MLPLSHPAPNPYTEEVRMFRSSSIVQHWRTALGGALAGTLLLAMGCASAPAASEGSEPTAAEAAAAEGEAQPAPSQGSPVTPEQLRERLEEASPAGTGGGRATVDPETDETAVTGWLHDPELDRRYYLARLPLEAIARRTPDGNVRTRYGGVPIKIDTEDADWIYYRVYDYSDVKQPVFRPRKTEEEKAAVAATYEFPGDSADRLRFVPFGDGLPGRGQWRQGFEIADMNGDGHLDIVHGPPRKQPGQGPVVYLGDGAGHWKRWDGTFPSMRYDYGDVAVGDFDGDGRPDVALAMHLLGMVALVQKEPGRFERWSEGLDYLPAASGAPSSFTARTVEAADWNGDGLDDLIVLGEGPKLAIDATPQLGGDESFGAVVYLNEGGGQWRRVDRGTGREQLFGDALEVTDLDGDGRLDFVTGTSALGRDDLLHLAAAGELWETAEIDVRPLARVSGVTSGDFDGDGRVDLALGYVGYEGEAWRAGVDVYLHGDDGWNRRAVWNEVTRDGVSALDAGDLDGDGRLDLVALTQDGELLAWRGRGDGAFEREPSDEVATFPGCAGFHVEIRDLDGDGRGDVVAGYAGEAGSEIIFEPQAAPRCPTQGALVAYRSER